MTTGKAAVTGLGCICAAGTSLDKTMRSMYDGRRDPAPPRHISTDLDKSYPVFEILEDLEGLYHTTLDRKPTRTTQLALIATEEALHRARLDPELLTRRRVGVCMGTTVGCTLNSEPFYREFRAGRFPDLEPVHRYLANNPAQFLADVFDLAGPVTTIANACSSGTDAIGLASSWIETNQCDIAIAGGCDELSRIPYLGFIHLLISSQRPCLPFDRNRKGLNLGEGAGAVILESESSARERRAEALAYVAGYGTFADAYHPTAPHPEGTGLKRAIRRALTESGHQPDQVDFVNAHGTATPDNDRIEGKVIGEVFGGEVPIVATKAYTGHTLGGAGGLEAAFTVQALLDRRIPPTAGFSEPDADATVRPTRETTSVQAKVAISSSLAFGGNNSVLVFQRRSG